MLRRYTILLILALLLTVGVAANAQRARAPQPSSGAAWEYLTVRYNPVFPTPQDAPVSRRKGVAATSSVREERLIQAILDDAGQQGWELVAVLGTPGRDHEFIFKRRP